MERKLFCVYDDEKKFKIGYYEATSAHKLILDHWKMFKKMNPFFYEDWEIIEYCDIFPDGKLNVDSIHEKIWSWDEYDLTEAKAQPMTKEDVEKLQNQYFTDVLILIFISG